MKILFLDTSSFFVTVAIIEDNKILYNYEEEIRNDMSSKILPIIRNGFDSISFDIKSIDRIMVVNGPGSFTGVRIGVTIAKLLAWSLKKDIICLSSLEFLATTKVQTSYIIPVIDARRGFVYAGVYNDKLDVILPDQYINKELLIEYLKDGTMVSNDRVDNSIKPNLDIMRIINKHINDDSINCHLVKPNYLKLTEAEEKFNKQ